MKTHHRSAVEADTRSDHRPWGPMIVALVAQVLVVIDISVVNTAMPTIGQELGLASSDLQWVVTAYLLLSGGCLLLGGRIADLLSRRAVFLTGLTMFTAASLFTGFAGGAAELIAGRAAQGAAAALMTPAALAIISTAYTGTQRARGLALWGAIGGLGIAVGVALGGVLTTWASWEAIFWVNVPIGVLAIAATLHVVAKDQKGPAGLAALRRPRSPRRSRVAGHLDVHPGPRGVRGLGLGPDRRRAGRRRDPGGGVRVPRAPRPAAPGPPAHLEDLEPGVEHHGDARHHRPAHGGRLPDVDLRADGSRLLALESGLAFLPLAVTLVLGTHLAAHGSAHLPARTIAAVGLAVVAGGALLLSRVEATSSYAGGLLPGLCLVGLGAGLVFAAVAGTAMNGIPAEHTGMASGFLMTGHEVGAALGVAVLSAVASTAGSLTAASGVVDAYARGALAITATAVVFAALAAVWMPAGKADAAHMHMH